MQRPISYQWNDVNFEMLAVLAMSASFQLFSLGSQQPQHHLRYGEIQSLTSVRAASAYEVFATLTAMPVKARR